MQIQQCEIILNAKPRGFHLVTGEILSQIDFLSQVNAGQLNLFIQHSSASLSINENADPSVRVDMENFFSELCDHKSYYTHTYEGADDMPAHIKSTIIGNNITVFHFKLTLKNFSIWFMAYGYKNSLYRDFFAMVCFGIF